MITKIGNITKIKTGKLDANASSLDGKYPFFTCSKEPLRISSYSYDCECVLVAGNGDLNVKYYKGKFDAYQRTYIIEDNSNGKLFMPFLYYYMENYLEELRKLSIGGVIKYIKLGNLTDAVIDLPDMLTQRAITSILAKIREIKAARQKQLDALDELVKARFIEMFGDPVENPSCWEEKSLSECLDIVGGYAFKSDLFEEQDGIPVLRIGNVNAGFFKPTNMVYWKEDACLQKYEVHPGDLVISLTGTVGKDDYGNVCMLGNDYEKYYLNQRNAKLEIKDHLDKSYLCQLLKFSSIKKRLTGINRGIRQANISNKDILSLVIPIPPLQLQKQYSIFIVKMKEIETTIRESLTETETLFQSLMQKYFG